MEKQGLSRNAHSECISRSLEASLENSGATCLSLQIGRERVCVYIVYIYIIIYIYMCFIYLMFVYNYIYIFVQLEIAIVYFCLVLHASIFLLPQHNWLAVDTSVVATWSRKHQVCW